MARALKKPAAAGPRAVAIPNEAPTPRTFGDLQLAFDHFNRTLFNRRLPQVLITLHRKKSTRGYFWAGRFALRSGESIVDEIALNPEAHNMLKRTDREVLSTLVHEMCHLEQQHFGKPSANGYHNAEWGAMMDKVGLTPKSITDPAKRTGTKVTHDIVEDGAFDNAFKTLAATGFALSYMEREFTDAEKVRAKKKTQSKTKFCCPTCDAAAWGKPTLRVVCGECEEEMEPEEK